VDNGFLTVYPVTHVDPATNFGHEWLPLNQTTYRVGDNEVVGKTTQFLKKYTNCIVLTKNDWECRYSDGPSTFGVRAGIYWEEPPDKDTKYVSRFEYLKLDCEWKLKDSGSSSSASALAQCMASSGK
jgi:hypothetical protein